MISDYASDIVDFVKDYVNEPVLLVGHSLGAMIVPIVAMNVPDKVRAIVMEDPPAFIPTESSEDIRNRFEPVLEIKRRPHAERVKYFIESQGKTPGTAQQNADDLEAMSEHVLLELLGHRLC